MIDHVHRFVQYTKSLKKNRLAFDTLRRVPSSNSTDKKLEFSFYRICSGGDLWGEHKSQSPFNVSELTYASCQSFSEFKSSPRLVPS